MYQPIQLKTTIPNSISRLPLRRGLFLIPLVLACFGLSPAARAVTPAPDGGYPGNNTAEGTNALFSLTTGTFNTALGFQALFHDTTGSSNTAVGVNTLFFNTAGLQNTAVGHGALAQNTGSRNVATGFNALNRNAAGTNNTAVGDQALTNNGSGSSNNAFGAFALTSNTTGSDNNALGDRALNNNVSGNANTAIGNDAGFNITGVGNVCIGAGVFGVAGEFNTTRIKNIGNTPFNTGRVVEVDVNGKLGFVTSSRRYKNEIKPMDKASEALFALKPVTFRYKGDIDPAHVQMFGLIAEEVEKVAPDLVVRNENGEVDTIRFDSINAMLLNEFLKEHRKVEGLEVTVAQQKKDFEATIAQQEKNFETTVAEQQKEIRALTAKLNEQAEQIQKVSAQLELKRSTPQVVANQ